VSCFDPNSMGYATLLGRAALVSDPAEKAKRWKDDWAKLYKDRNRGDDYLLIKVTPIRLEVSAEGEGIRNDRRPGGRHCGLQVGIAGEPGSVPGAPGAWQFLPRDRPRPVAVSATSNPNRVATETNPPGINPSAECGVRHRRARPGSPRGLLPEMAHV